MSSGPQNFRASLPVEPPSWDCLQRFNIQFNGLLHLKSPDEISEPVAASRNLGSDKQWSDGMMHQHISFLSNNFTSKRIFSRAVIDTFMFRATVMIPPPDKLVVVSEDITPMDINPGGINYTAIVGNPNVAELHLQLHPMLDERQGDIITSAFFVAMKNAPVAEQLYYVVLELIARAKSMGKFHIRGALTSGTKWTFVAVDLNPNNDGAEYWVSEEIEFFSSPLIPGASDTDPLLRVREPSLIAAILSTWVQQSFQEFREDQWFTHYTFMRRGGE
ncbi:hypothetical protein DFP72DRAFT_1078836 [Ephemerocybe angulata]|uniref:Uncharacterized protein n=1 Tax=Ephemerocybe angulata TaxID=980116 RepID=A0A8H6LVK9_9AGAR|nr:hypothetical protein DFP72DRAFT_1078836 [Tulosesus angulatus]